MVIIWVKDHLEDVLSTVTKKKLQKNLHVQTILMHKVKDSLSRSMCQSLTIPEMEIK